MNGQSQIKNISNLFPISLKQVLEALLLMGAGMLVIFLRARFRTPLHLPGHHGVEYMLIILSARMISRFRWTAVFTALGIATAFLLPSLGFHDPFKLLAYMIPCISLDLLYQVYPKWHKNIWALSIMAGFSYSLIPVFRVIIGLFTGIFYPSLLKGFAYPYFSHFLYGFVGAIMAAGAINLIRKHKK